MAKRPYDTRRWRQTIRPQILRRDGYTCQIQYPDTCTHTAEVVDHIIPWQHGGPWYDPWNLRAACKPCNTKRTHIPDPPTHTTSRNW